MLWQIIPHENINPDPLLRLYQRRMIRLRNQHPHRRSHLVPRILVDDCVNRSADQCAARSFGDFMGDEDDVLGAARGVESCNNALGTTTHVVNADEVLMFFQDLGSERLCPSHIVT